MKLGHVALDGTKMAAKASKHKANSYDRMKEQERKLQAEIAGLMSEKFDEARLAVSTLFSAENRSHYVRGTSDTPR